MNEYIFVEGGMIGTNRHVIGRGLRQMLPMICLLLAVPVLAQPDHQWVLEKSTLTYHVSHPLHDTDGISHAARGKVVCHVGQCDVLIVAPGKSFDSGDSNRDLHMVQTTHGAQFPIISVRIRSTNSARPCPTAHCALKI